MPVKIRIGVDEVGRGCLAGPVVACAFCFRFEPEEIECVLRALESEKRLRLTDSKLISPTTRQKWAEILPQLGDFEIAEASVAEIDETHILKASLLAMRRSVENLSLKTQQPWFGKRDSPNSNEPGQAQQEDQEFLVKVDGNQKIPGLPSQFKQETVIGGDLKVLEISAASILAKVYRDQLMVRISAEYPVFGWEKNKGYGSRDHLYAIQNHGVTPWHRKSFAGVKGIKVYGESDLP